MVERKRHDLTGYSMDAIRVAAPSGAADHRHRHWKAQRALANIAAYVVAEAGVDLRPGATLAELCDVADAHPDQVAAARKQRDLLVDMLGLGPDVARTPGRCKRPDCGNEIALSRISPSSGLAGRGYCSKACQRHAERERDRDERGG
jgi:hypothetical protein